MPRPGPRLSPGDPYGQSAMQQGFRKGEGRAFVTDRGGSPGLSVPAESPHGHPTRRAVVLLDGRLAFRPGAACGERTTRSATDTSASAAIGWQVDAPTRDEPAPVAMPVPWLAWSGQDRSSGLSLRPNPGAGVGSADARLQARDYGLDSPWDFGPRSSSLAAFSGPAVAALNASERDATTGQASRFRV
jgi:hypothetical protein